MKTPSPRSHVIVILFALLAGCSGSASSPTPAGNTLPSTQSFAPDSYAGLHDLYVADYGEGQIVLLKNDHYVPDGTINTGINGPFDVTLDRGGNLYVANRNGGNVTEYAPGSTQPSFVYSAGMMQPLSIAVDRQGHLFETDSPVFGGTDTVNEYDQRSNTVLYTCPVPGVFGVSVDKAGDVFVDYNIKSQGARIAEYESGLAGCSPTELGTHVANAGGIALDSHGNLILANGISQRVDVIAPPYSKVTRRLKLDFGSPIFVSINANERKVFVSDESMRQFVYVLDYTTGKVIRRLGSSHGGFGIPMAAVDGPNDVQ